MNLNIIVKNQLMKRTDRNNIVNLSEKYLKLVFTFSDEWEDFIKYVFFKTEDGNYRYLIEDNAVVVPNKILANYEFTFGVYGVNTDEVRITTNQLTVKLLDSGFPDEWDDLDDETRRDIVDEICIRLQDKSDKGHTHSTDDILDLNTVYYDKTGIKNLIESLKKELDNKISINGDKNIIETGDTLTLSSYSLENGVPKANKTIYFFKVTEED